MKRILILLGCTVIILIAASGCTTYSPPPITPATTTTAAIPTTTVPAIITSPTITVPTIFTVPSTTVTTAQTTTTPIPTTLVTTTLPPPGSTIFIEDFTFYPSSVRVPVGATVTWTNLDTDYQHQIINDATATFGQGQIFESNPLERGQSYSFTFNEAGIYYYHCNIHPYMKGTIIVT